MEWFQIIIIAVFAYLALMVFTFVILLDYDENGSISNPRKVFIPHPAHLHSVRNVNWFGACVLYILYIIFWFPIWLCVFIHYLFTVGRKSK